MAKMVTRTIATTQVTVLGVSKTAGESMNKSFVVPGEIVDNDKALKIVNKMLPETSDFVPALVVELSTTTAVRGMTEEDFIEHSIIVERPESQRKKN